MGIEEKVSGLMTAGFGAALIGTGLKFLRDYYANLHSMPNSYSTNQLVAGAIALALGSISLVCSYQILKNK